MRHDIGTQFTSYHYRELASVLSLKLSRTAYRHPDSNAFIERLFGSLKTELVWPEEFQDFEHALARISWWISDYNTARPPSSLGYRTPKEVRDEFFAKDPTLSAA